MKLYFKSISLIACILMITNVVGCSTKTNEETIFTKDEEITSQTSEVSKETTTDSTTETTTEELKDSDGLEFVSLGDGTALVRGIGTCNDKNIVIPSKTPEGDTVIEIAAGAFAKNIDIVSIKLPDTVKLIGSSCHTRQGLTLQSHHRLLRWTHRANGIGCRCGAPR